MLLSVENRFINDSHYEFGKMFVTYRLVTCLWRAFLLFSAEQFRLPNIWCIPIIYLQVYNLQMWLWSQRSMCVHVLCGCPCELYLHWVSASFPVSGLMRQEGPNPIVHDCVSPQEAWIKHDSASSTPVSLNQARKKASYSSLPSCLSLPVQSCPFFCPSPYSLIFETSI